MNRIKELRKKHKMTLEKLGDKLNLANNTISQYETGKREPSLEVLEKLSEIFNVSVDYLLGREDFSPRKGIKIPVLGIVPAGIPIEAIEEILDYEEITPEMASKGSYFALKVDGDSMAPRILDGDILIIRKQCNIENGETAVVRVNGFDATVKKIKKDEHGIMLIPNNSAYAVKYYSNREIEELPVEIIGKAVEIRSQSF